MQGKTERKKFMHKMGLMLTLNQNCNFSRKVFQNAPNGIKACPDFQNFPGGGCPRTPLLKWASRPAGLICGAQNAERETKSPKQAKPNRSACT